MEPAPARAISDAPEAGHAIPLGDAVRVWWKIALLSFGGPAGQIALMHRILVEEKKWISEARFLHALNFAMLLPGPEAQQLATYVGWLLHRLKGGLIAGTLFILPGFVAIMALSWIYLLWGDAGLVAGLFFGLKAAVLAIVAAALLRLGARALAGPAAFAVAASAFVAIFLFDLPFPLIVLGAGLIGLVFAGVFASGASAHGEDVSALGDAIPDHARPNRRRALCLSLIFLTLWLAPIGALLLWLGPANVFSEIGLFFAQMAVVTFGGAYAVLAYVAQQAVDAYGWLQPGEMLDGLGMAETTPGPLIMVTQFVGFMGAARQAGFDPLIAGTLGALLATWVTFVPCFLWIFVGAPFAERLRGNRALSGALAAITAAVVGVILNLGLWFAMHSLFAQTRTLPALPTLELPVWTSLDPAALVLTLAALIAVFAFRVGTLPLIAGAALVGMGWALFSI